MKTTALALALIACFATSTKASTTAGAGPLGARKSIISMPDAGKPAALRDVGFDQRLGEGVPLDARVVDERGVPRRLGALLGERPAILLPAYFACPMLCPLTIEGLIRAIKPLSFEVGRDFDVFVLSFDPEDGPEEAARQKAAAVRRYGREGREDGFRFLTAEEATIDQIMEAIGYRFARVEKTGEFAHPAGFAVLTPTGRISRYLFGLDPAPRDVRLALVESAEGRIGGAIDQVLLFCFQYDPSHGRYSAVALGSMRFLAAVTAASLGSFIGLALWRERRRRPEPVR